MFDLWETARQRPASGGSDDAVTARPNAGLIAGWGPMRAARLRQLQRPQAFARPGPARRPSLRHLAWVCQQQTQVQGINPTPQVIAAAADMLDGAVADLACPEDRAWALALAAIATAVSGHQVHLICLAEPCAARMCERMAELVARTGVSVAHIKDEADIDRRIEGHQARIVIASAARLAQDRMRDRALLHGRANGNRFRVEALARGAAHGALIRGEPFAFVDDADLLMIEVPRPIGFGSDPEDDANRLRAEEAFVVLRGLTSGTHYTVDASTRRIRLTAKGEAILDLAATLFEGPWLRLHWREETILAALTIRDFFQPGQGLFGRRRSCAAVPTFGGFDG